MKIIDDFGQIDTDIALVDFFATWCGPCKKLAPFLESLSKKYHHIGFYKVDVDDSPDLAEDFDISAMPTILFLKGGEVVGKVVGANEAEIVANLEKF